MNHRDVVNQQKAHYEAIHDDYESHYYDRSSMAYRNKFIYQPLFSEISLVNASVADLACGSGHNSLWIKQYHPAAVVTGYDISATACAAYRTRTERPAHEIDLTIPQILPDVYDAALVIGGLHHCVRDLPTTMRNIARMV